MDALSGDDRYTDCLQLEQYAARITKSPMTTFTNNIQNIKRAVIAGVGILALALPATAFAASQNYSVLNNSVQPGMLVSLTSNADVIEPATTKNANLLNGIATAGITNINQQPGQVNVENDGKVSALVSTVNGDVNVGDRISPSSISGVGGKLQGNGWVVGVAQASLNAKTDGAVASVVTDSKGSKHNVVIARIPLIVRVNYYGAATTAASSDKTTKVPSSLQSAADSLAGKHASLVGVLLSFLLIAIGVFLAGQIITSAIKSAFAAIARQPLSKAVVTRLILKTFAIAAVIVAGVILGAAVILRLF